MLHNMKTKPPKTMSDVLRQAIRERLETGLPMLRLAQETGIERVSLIRFSRGDQSLRLDIADRLAVYFGLELVAKKEPPRRGQ